MEKDDMSSLIEASVLLALGVIAFLFGYFCLGIFAPLIGIPLWITSTKRLARIEGNIQLNKTKRLLNASLIFSIISVFNGPMMFFFVQPINFRAFLVPMDSEKINYLAANSGESLGFLAIGVIVPSVLFVPFLFFDKTRKLKVYLVFITVFNALFNMLYYARLAGKSGLDEQNARITGLLIVPFYLSFILVFFSKTRKWYILVPLLAGLGLLAGSEISRINPL